MSLETMLSFLSNSNQEQQLNFKVAALCAPVLKGIKASNLISVKAGMYRYVRRMLKGSNIHCVLLYHGKREEVLLLYRTDLLINHLKKSEVKDFLEKYGYLDLSLPGILKRLEQRYIEYRDGNWDFPHELGVLLEYPTADVMSFIEQKGKNCLLEKYWKVYHNKEQAEKIFSRYDSVKEEAIRQIVEGYPLSKVAVS